jgi:exoribonuclease R
MADPSRTRASCLLLPTRSRRSGASTLLTHFPNEMKEADRRADELEQPISDFVEAAILADRCREVLDDVIVELHKRGGTVQDGSPRCSLPCDGRDLKLGSTVRVRLLEADPSMGSIKFRVEDAAS